MKKITADRVKLALTLFLSYFKIGLFTFGGGYAMIALIEREFVVRKKWINEVELYEIIAIAESTPGPIAINCATFVGYKILGFVGSFLATLAVCIPSFAIIYLISVFYDAFMALTAVAYAFEGIKVGIAIMITVAGVNMIKKGKKNAFAVGVFLLTFAAATCIDIFSLDFSTIYIILSGAALGIILQIIRDIVAKKKGAEKEKASGEGKEGENNGVSTGMAAKIICRDGDNAYGMGEELRHALENGGEKKDSTEDDAASSNNEAATAERNARNGDDSEGGNTDLTDTGNVKSDDSPECETSSDGRKDAGKKGDGV